MYNTDSDAVVLRYYTSSAECVFGRVVQKLAVLTETNRESSRRIINNSKLWGQDHFLFETIVFKMFSVRQTFSAIPRSACLVNRSANSRVAFCHRIAMHSYFSSHRTLHWSCTRYNDASSRSPDSAMPSAPATVTSQEIKLEAPEPRLSLTFTCTVTNCSTRSTHEFTRRSYERGIVIVECPGCKNRRVLIYASCNPSS